jgi:hypothetical protein
MFGRPYGTWFLSPLVCLAMNRQATFVGLYETSVTRYYVRESCLNEAKEITQSVKNH